MRFGSKHFSDMIDRKNYPTKDFPSNSNYCGKTFPETDGSQASLCESFDTRDGNTAGLNYLSLSSILVSDAEVTYHPFDTEESDEICTFFSSRLWCLYFHFRRLVPISDEKVLIHDLLSNYVLVGKHGRPVVNLSSTIYVEFGLGLIQMDLDEKYKVLKMSMWARYVSLYFHWGGGLGWGVWVGWWCGVGVGVCEYC